MFTSTHTSRFTQMSTTRTIADIEADITAVKTLNPNWLTNGGDKALITAYINEKNALSAPPAPVQPGNCPIL